MAIVFHPLKSQVYLFLYQSVFIFSFSNGRGRSGTFVAVYNSTERLKVEQLIDVLQCVRAIRISLADAVENKVNNSVFRLSIFLVKICES